jgi:hypothetical protein
MWDDDAPLVFVRLKQYYLVHYAALPSNTHLAELSVKDANFCQVKGRAKNLSSTFPTARSRIVETLNQNAIAAFKAHGNIIKGTEKMGQITLKRKTRRE